MSRSRSTLIAIGGGEIKDLPEPLETGKAADVLVMTQREMELKEVISLGRRLVKDGRLSFSEKFLKESNRKVRLDGEKSGEHAQPPSHFASEKKRVAHAESFVCEGK